MQIVALDFVMFQSLKHWIACIMLRIHQDTPFQVTKIFFFWRGLQTHTLVTGVPPPYTPPLAPTKLSGSASASLSEFQPDLRLCDEPQTESVSRHFKFGAQ